MGLLDHLVPGLHISPVGGASNSSTIDSARLSTFHPGSGAELTDATVIGDTSGPRFTAAARLDIRLAEGDDWEFRLTTEAETAVTNTDRWRIYENPAVGFSFHGENLFARLLGGPAFVLTGPVDGKKIGAAGKIVIGGEFLKGNVLRPVIALELGGLYVGDNGPRVRAFYGDCVSGTYGNSCFIQESRLDTRGTTIGLVAGVDFDLASLHD
ncbi:MAG: hypothetical protein Q7S98_02250 [Deltaproteobacteria bacterium]|nr:hypothetical protein [Deltaproteobacteria bacterium]